MVGPNFVGMRISEYPVSDEIEEIESECFGGGRLNSYLYVY